MSRDDAFTRLYQQMYPRVYGYVSRRADSELASDVTDETFAIAWRRHDQLPTAALPWLLVTARNTLADRLRRSGKRDALTAELASVVPREARAADEVALERVVVLSALATLAPSDRELLMLVAWDGLTTRQAAVMCECSTSAVGVRLHRARRRFQDALQRAESQPAPPHSRTPALSRVSIDPEGSRLVPDSEPS